MLSGVDSGSKMVSIILPVYNAADFLKDAINSILNQTYTFFELIIINDGSTDRSEEIVQSYTDKRIKYYYQKNAGVASTLNKGIEFATGKYIWRHDADDISLPEKLEKEVQFLEANQDVDLCSCQVAFMTESGKVAWSYKQPKTDFFNAMNFVEVKREHFNPYSPITHGTVLIRTAVMKALGGYRKEFITGEDVDLWLRLIQQYKAVVLYDCLSLHRLSNHSATTIHGWKNEFFRNLAFKYYDQRANGAEDDLQRSIYPEIPHPVSENKNTEKKGKLFRSDLLLFLFPLHLNAKDWKGSRKLVSQALKDGWKLSATWKAIVFPLLGKKIVNAGVRVKSFFRG